MERVLIFKANQMKNIVWLRCDGRNPKLFILRSKKEMITVPIVGDFIQAFNKDFATASFRMKGDFSSKHCCQRQRDFVSVKFKVVERDYCSMTDEWTLICEPTSDSLIYLIQKIKV